MDQTSDTLIAPDRFQRQADIVPRERITEHGVTVIGVGAGGRNVALQLAAIGVPRLQIVDFDTVDVPNITTQMYSHNDIGRPKVEALYDEIGRMTDDCEVEPIAERWRPTMDNLHPIVFCCVDKIAARENIWKQLGVESQFWSDGRMLGETIRVLTASDKLSREYYPTTLFAEEEANRGRCTAQSTVYAANIGAAFQVHQFTRWLRGLPIDRDLTLDLLSSDLFMQ